MNDRSPQTNPNPSEVEAVTPGVTAAVVPLQSLGEEPPLTIVRPRRGWQSLALDDLWRHREIVYFLTWRDIKVRYKQTVLGVAWAVLQPVATTVVFAVFLGKLGGLSQFTDVPYPVFVYAGILPWSFFAEAVGQSSQSLIASSSLLTKVYFPRLAIPVASAAGLVVDFAISLIVMGCMMAMYRVAPGPGLVALPLLILAAVGAALGAGTLLAALSVAYRDFRYVVPFLLQIWMFASPVAYPLHLVPEKWQVLYALNPLAGIIDAFRWALLGKPLHGTCLAVSVATAAMLFVIGIAYFRRLERRFADIV